MFVLTCFYTVYGFDVGANTGSDAPIGRCISVWLHSSPREGDSPSLSMQTGLWKQIMWTDRSFLCDFVYSDSDSEDDSK